MSNNDNYDERNASFREANTGKTRNPYYLDQSEENNTELYNNEELARAWSLPSGHKERKTRDISFRPSQIVHGRISDDIYRLILPLSMVHRNYNESKEDVNLLLHASPSSFSFYYNEETEEEINELSISDKNLHSVFRYESLERIAFYKSHHGAFNRNPNESIGEDIMHLDVNDSEVQESQFSIRSESMSTGLKRDGSRDSSGTISKIFNLIFKKKSQKSSDSTPKNETFTTAGSMDRFNSLRSVPEDWLSGSDDSDETSEECYMTIDYRASSHRRSESVHFRTKLSNMRKICKFIGNLFPRHSKVKSSSVFVELPELERRANILTKELLAELMHFVPVRFQSRDLNIVYSTYYHGHSLKTLYRYCENLTDGFFLLMIREANGAVFGALLSDAPRISNTRYYGDPSCVIFRSDSEKGTIVYRWSGILDYFIHCDREFMLIGGCQGSGVAIFLDDNLLRGRSSKSDTFMSHSLSDAEDFVIVGLELWILGENVPPDSSRSVSFYAAN